MTKRYQCFNMTTPQSRERLAAVVAAMKGRREATNTELALASGISEKTIVRFIAHLCDEGVMRVTLAYDSKFPSVKARYAMAAAHAEAEFEAPEGDAEPFIKRTVGANDWKRGEHCKRASYLVQLWPLGYAFPAHA